MLSSTQVEHGVGLSRTGVAIACSGMALFYVAVLYAPTVVLRMPPPSDYQEFLIRRFLCSAVSSVVSICVCAFLLPIQNGDVNFLAFYGIRKDHFWQAVVFPLLLTSLMYAGSLAVKLFSLLEFFKECGGCVAMPTVKALMRESVGNIYSTAFNVLAWRSYVVAPVTEELVFRACMIPLLLCGGFGVKSTILFSPILFSLAHLNHWMEIYARHNYSMLKASLTIGLQLGYTVIFGSYASFLYIRTGNLFSPLVAHVFCNYMGLPVVFAGRKGVLTLAVFGSVTFLCLLIPMTQPKLYNDRISNCRCWEGHCSWTATT